MKKIIIFISVVFALFATSCESNEGSSPTRARIIAEDFVKQDVISANDLEWDVVGVDETATDTYHVVANIKTLNGFGMKVPRKVSVRLKYNSGDWAETSSWTCESIRYLDESTGRQQYSR